jgi:hypothetical protein
LSIFDGSLDILKTLGQSDYLLFDPESMLHPERNREAIERASTELAVAHQGVAIVLDYLDIRCQEERHELIDFEEKLKVILAKGLDDTAP